MKMESFRLPSRVISLFTCYY